MSTRDVFPWTENPLMDAKKVILLLVVLFVGFWMFTDPSGLADAAKTGGSEGWALVTDGFRGLIRFIGELG